MSVKNIVKRFLGSDLRTKKVSKNIVVMGILQVINILISFMLVPIVMDFVSPEQYGIWLTISSMVAWLSILDVGLGAGMKNRLTEALAKKDMRLAKEYVSTTYISLTCLVGGGYSCFCVYFLLSIGLQYIIRMKT